MENFDLGRYLGTWYEIARLDHSFERGLSRVSAEYSLNPDGSLRVVNRGYDVAKSEWREAEGRALFVDSPDKGYLKVSFFGPFYGSYVIFGLDGGYRHSFVSGPDTDYLWLLAREPLVADRVYQGFVEEARSAGFDTDRLIRVEH